MVCLALLLYHILGVPMLYVYIQKQQGYGQDVGNQAVLADFADYKKLNKQEGQSAQTAQGKQ